MNSDIFVQLESPWKYTSGGMGKGLIENPPKNIKYLFRRQKKIVSSQNRVVFTRFLKKIIMIVSNILPLIKSREISVIDPKIKIIHCEHFLCKNKDIPWVVDTEGLWQFFLGKKTDLKKIKIKNILLRYNCKKIICWADNVKKNILNTIPELKGKVITVYPAAQSIKFKKNKKKETTLLFVGRSFYGKGGFHALEVMNILTKKFDNVSAIYAGEIPEWAVKKYSKNKKIKILGVVSHKDLMKKVYPESDILIYPGYQDSFGFAYLEAMSFGIPIITTRRPNTEEIINVGNTGYLVECDLSKISIDKLESHEKKLVLELCNNASILIEDKRLIQLMSRNCLNAISNGKFSVKERNQKMREVYEEALR